MRDTFPQYVRVRLVSAVDQSPLGGLAVLVTVIALRKNDYPVGPKISDDSGMVTFSRKELEESIELNQKHFPMDYAGSLEECSGIRIEVLGASELEKLIEAREMWGGAIPELKLSEGLRACLRDAQKRIECGTSKVVSDEGLGSVIVVAINA